MNKYYMKVGVLYNDQMSYTKVYRLFRSLRERIAFIGAAFITIMIGLLVHLTNIIPSNVARDVIGDALWAMMIVWCISALIPKYSSNVRAIISLLICWIVEFSQLYHAPILDDLRSKTIGHLVLGSGFDVRDLVSYAVGVAVALAIIRIVCRNKQS